MKNKEKTAFGIFNIAMLSWVITLVVTPVGGWHESNPLRLYYMSAFFITGVLTIITMLIYHKTAKSCQG